MFSLKTLLDKVTSVQSELTDKLNTSPSWEKETPDFPEDVDISTGSELLNTYQQLWEDLHTTSMSQAESGAAAAASIARLHAWLGRQDALMNQLTTGVAELPLLTDTVEKCIGIVRETGLNLSSLLVELDKLEEDCDKLHVERMKSVHRHHLDSYREERHRELLQKKAAMEKNYQDSVRVRAIKECLVLKERHKTFNDEFERDMENYKVTGNFSVRDAQTAPLDTVESLQSAPLDTLENFVPEEDPDLSSFLGSERTSSVISDSRSDATTDRTSSIRSSKSDATTGRTSSVISSKSDGGTDQTSSVVSSKSDGGTDHTSSVVSSKSEEGTDRTSSAISTRSDEETDNSNKLTEVSDVQS